MAVRCSTSVCCATSASDVSRNATVIGLLVLRDRLVPERLLRLIGRLSAGRPERSGRPRSRPRLQMLNELLNMSSIFWLWPPNNAPKADRGIEVGHRHADLGIGTDHGLLGLLDVRAALEHVGRQAERCLRHDLFRERHAALDCLGVRAQAARSARSPAARSRDSRSRCWRRSSRRRPERARPRACESLPALKRDVKRSRVC